MEGLMFLAVRCFSCEVFQVNQRTKSGKWKCRMCGESQSIVKIWGRGGRAEDIRRLVMELNAVAGEGEDPNATVESFSSQLEARDASGGSNLLVPSRGAVLGHSSRSGVDWGQRRGFVSASFARSGEVATGVSFDESRSGDGNLRKGRSWHGGSRSVRELGSGRPAMTVYESCGTRTGTDHQITRQVIASAASSSGRSRWGVFAASRANTFLKRSSAGTHQEVEDPKFVTSLPSTANTARRADGKQGQGRKRTFQTARDVSRKSSVDHAMSEPRWTVGAQRDSDFPENIFAEEDPEIRPASRQRRGQDEAVCISGTDRASADPWATAVGPIERMQPKSWGSLNMVANREYSYGHDESDRLPKPLSRRSDDSRMTSDGGMSVDTSSRWSKFVR